MAKNNKTLVGDIKKDLAILRAPKGRAQERRRAELLHRGLRWGAQAAFFVAFPGVWSAAFSGVKYLCQQVGGTDVLEVSGFLALLLALFAYTCVFGRFFCGYACSFGFLGDAVYALATPLRRALGLDGAKKRRISPAVRSKLRLIKYALLLAICAACFRGVWGRVSGFSPWGAFAGLRAGSIDGVAAGAFGALAAVAVGMALEERFFCQFLCPLGALFALLPVVPASLFRRDRATCVPRCNRCQERCPVGIHPDRHALDAGECIECGRCADGCPVSNVSLVRIEKAVAERGAAGGGVGSGTGGLAVSGAKNPAVPRPGRPAEPRFCIRGTEVTLVLLKAVALALLCYAFA